MGLDGELTGIVREVVQFLECLREVKLPATLENIRENLLTRSKDTLTMLMVDKMGRSSSPESYLNMNAASSKGLVVASKPETAFQKYASAGEQKQQHQDYYETFEPAASSVANANSVTDRPRSKDDRVEETVLDVYTILSAAQTKLMCQKCGPLFRKEAKKLFVFEQYRTCWVGLLGQRLLIYGSERDSRPYAILSIRGYMARSAPNAVPRDQRRSECAFEIFCPGSRTLQFIARTPKDMEQWVAKICEISSSRESNDVSQLDVWENPCYKGEERFGNAGDKEANDSLPKDSVTEVTEPPPLPARIPRRLPSLPVGGSTSSYRFHEQEEDDNIYHKIEDFRDTMRYGNIGKASKPGTDNDRLTKEFTTYDDIHATKTENKPEERETMKKEDSVARQVESETMYDDAVSISQTDSSVPVKGEHPFVPYDDVENLIGTVKSMKVQATDKPEEPVKSPQKKSFLDRVRSRKESPRKVEKKVKCKPPATPPVNVLELPTYDDVSDLIATTEETKRALEPVEYTCPPPPRPIYANPPTTTNQQQPEFYDNVTASRETYRDEEVCRLEQQTQRKLNYIHSVASCADEIDNIRICEKNNDDSPQSFQDADHYKTPRNEPCHRRPSAADEQEELYDDIAILADFTARQRESSVKKENEDTKMQIGSEKKPWNRFVSSRKSKVIETTVTETTSRVLSSTEDTDDLTEQQSIMRMNTFQKLISKMENSLGKVSVRTASPSMLLNKTNVTNILSDKIAY